MTRGVESLLGVLRGRHRSKVPPSAYHGKDIYYQQGFLIDSVLFISGQRLYVSN